MIHQLKTKAEYFEEIEKGLKPFEVRNNDRNFHVGDFLALNELAAAEQFGETGRCMLVEVTYILKSPDFCRDGQVIMGIRPCHIVRQQDRNIVTDKNHYSVPVYDGSSEKEEIPHE